MTYFSIYQQTCDTLQFFNQIFSKELPTRSRSFQEDWVLVSVSFRRTGVKDQFCYSFTRFHTSIYLLFCSYWGFRKSITNLKICYSRQIISKVRILKWRIHRSLYFSICPGNSRCDLFFIQGMFAIFSKEIYPTFLNIRRTTISSTVFLNPCLIVCRRRSAPPLTASHSYV